MTLTNRRSVLTGAAALTGATFLSRGLAAQGTGPIKFGSLVPLSGAGGAWGPLINASHKLVLDEVNAAGGVIGRKIELVTEDTQTNPENGVRAAHKLLDVDQVSVVMGTWASAVCSAVAPLMWEAKTPFFIIGAADSITQLPHQGYIFRTQPNTTDQSRQFANFALLEGVKNFYLMMPQTPFTEQTFKAIAEICEPKGVKVTSVIYDPKKTSFRSEVDAMMKVGPDMLMAGGYQPDTITLAKDVYRANFKGKIVGYAYAINDQFIAGAGKQVAEGAFAMEAMPDPQSTAYARLKTILKRDNLDIYTCHGYDQANLTVLAIAAAKSATGTAIRDNIRVIGNKDGVKVDNALDGLKALAAGKAVNYLGASSTCKFLPSGDVESTHFRFSVVKDGKQVDYRMI